MDRGTAKRSVGLLDHTMKNNEWNALFLAFDFKGVIQLEVILLHFNIIVRIIYSS